MAFEEQVIVVLYVIVGAVAAMIISLRKIYSLEKKILRLEELLLAFDEKLSKKFKVVNTKKAKK
ncbi:MAG: hypothetical protein ABIB71_04410 [Candidatus Woesearchaeota archaeon]